MLRANLQANIHRMPPPTTANMVGFGDFLKRGGLFDRTPTRSRRQERPSRLQSGEQVVRNCDRGHLERDCARVADDLRADPYRRRAVAYKIGAYE